MRYGYGVDLGGTTVKLARFDETGSLLHKWEIPTRKEENGTRILPDIAAAIAENISTAALDRTQILGIGIGVPGPVDEEGVVNKCVNLGWGVFNIETTLSQLTDLPVKAGNDATVAALGECWKGGGQGCKTMVFVTLGTGVGGGIVVGGKVLRGTHGAGGEIGHMAVNRNEPEICSCGKQGCLEQYCSATGVVRLAKQALENTHTPSNLRSLEVLTCKDIFHAAAAGDSLAATVLEQVYHYLGEALANICNVVDPEAVVIGGGVSKAGQPLLDGARRYFAASVFHAVHPVDFRLAELGNDAGAYGAFKLILD